MTTDLNRAMRDDWNRRAREDAHYYVAFGRRDQDRAEFFATAAEIAHSLESELQRLPPDVPAARRALEIGCGPGRLMRPLAKHFGEIFGVDVSDEMISRAREYLADIPHAHPVHAPGSDLRAFADDSFDFVYSYAVFQHIPDRETVFRYFHETRRVLKTGGIARLQINGLPETAARYDTWSGVRISAADVAAFALDNDLQLLALEGASTQYMWTTWRKRPAGWYGLPPTAPGGGVRLARITNSLSSEPAAPAQGRFASVSLWFYDLPAECDLSRLLVQIGGRRAFVTYIGPRRHNRLHQVTAYLPPGLRTGLHRVEVRWGGEPLCSPGILRVVPPPPAVPRVASVSDGIDLLAGARIVTGAVKLVIEELENPEQLAATVAGRPVSGFEIFCTDPRVPTHEVNFRVPEGVPPGAAAVVLSAGRRRFAPVVIEVAPPLRDEAS